jgi:hypothetical protein
MPYWRSDNEKKSMALPGMKMRKTRVHRTKRDNEKEGGSAHGSECGTSFSMGMMAVAYHSAEVRLSHNSPTFEWNEEGGPLGKRGLQ